MNASRPLARTAVAGCGHWGKNLCRNFSKLGHLQALCENDPKQRASIASQYPAAKAYASYEDLLNDGDVDAVVIATPAVEHFHMAMSAIEAGKDLFVEKPLALDWQEGQKLHEEAKARGLVLMVGHLLRYHPAIVKIQELLAQGVLGKVEYIYSNRVSMGKIRREENALWSFAPHDISVINALVGGLPLLISCTGGAYLQPNIADVTVSNLLFDNGVRAHIFVSWLHPWKEQRLAVLGSRQIIVFEDSRPNNKLMLYDKRIEWNDGIPTAAKSQGVAVEFSTDEPLERECAHFLSCVRERCQPLTDGDEGVGVLQVLQACQRSLQLNGEPIQVTPRALRQIVHL